jgi:hypothetical protein
VIRVHILDAGRRLAAVDEIRSTVEATCERAGTLLDLHDVDVVVYENRWGVIPELGCGGTSPGPHIAMISVDPGPAFDARWRTELGPTVAHELHHCKRFRSSGSYGSTLREALASEGLAQHFEATFRGSPPPYAIASDHDLTALWDRAIAELDAVGYSHASWFFGGDGIPRWAGYALAWAKVGQGLARVGSNAAAAWAIPAADLVVDEPDHR